MVGMSDAVDRARIAKIQGWSDSVRTSLMGSRVSEWKFDEAAGTLALDTVGANTGTLLPASTGPAWTTSSCVSGACLEFDGVDDYVSIPFDLKTIRTLSVWYKNAVITVDNAGFFSGSNNISWKKQSINDWQLYLSNGVTSYRFRGISPLSSSVWTNEVFVLNDDNTLNRYRNGVLIGNHLVSDYTVVSAATTILKIGVSNTYIQASIDEVRVYNDALPASAVRNQYLAGLDRLLDGGAVAEQEYRQRLAGLDSIYAARE